MVAVTKIPGWPDVRLRPNISGEVLMHCPCGAMVTMPIMHGFLVHIRCECGRFVAYRWPARLSRWMLLEVD